MHDQLGGEADRRNCPRCGNLIMAAATLCGHCWLKQTALAPGSPGTRVGPPIVAPIPDPVDESLRRDCPTCGRRMMAAATLCGYCWTKVEPLIATVDPTPHISDPVSGVRGKEAAASIRAG